MGKSVFKPTKTLLMTRIDILCMYVISLEMEAQLYTVVCVLCRPQQFLLATLQVASFLWEWLGCLCPVAIAHVVNISTVQW